MYLRNYSFPISIICNVDGIGASLFFENPTNWFYQYCYIFVLSVFNMVHISNSISTVNKKDFGGAAIFFSFSCSFHVSFFKISQIIACVSFESAVPLVITFTGFYRIVTPPNARPVKCFLIFNLL